MEVVQVNHVRIAAESVFTQGLPVHGPLLHGQSDSRFPKMILRTGVRSLFLGNIWALTYWKGDDLYLPFFLYPFSPTKVCLAFGNSLVSWSPGNLLPRKKRGQPWLALYLSASECKCSRSYYQINYCLRKKKIWKSPHKVTYESPWHWSPWSMREHNDARQKEVFPHPHLWNSEFSLQRSLTSEALSSTLCIERASFIIHVVFIFQMLCVALVW